MEQDSEITIFEDEEDCVEDIKDQLREVIKNYTLYTKLFSYPRHWRAAKQEMKRFFAIELEDSFSESSVKESDDGTIKMKVDENEM